MCLIKKKKGGPVRELRGDNQPNSFFPAAHFFWKGVRSPVSLGFFSIVKLQKFESVDDD